MIQTKELLDNMDQRTDICLNDERIGLGFYKEYEVKHGFHDKNGNGMVAGLTKVSKTEPNKVMDGVKAPYEGKLFCRDYNIYDPIGGVAGDNRLGFEEIAYLLFFGELPNGVELSKFGDSPTYSRTLSTSFVRNVVMKVPSKDMVVSLSESIPTLASYDDETWNIFIPNVLRQSMMLISVIPMLAACSYHVFNHYERDRSMYIRRPDEELSTAENLPHLLHPDVKYSQVEAHVLNLVLILRIEHSGGNNSTFTAHVVTSSGTDTYPVISAALASLKGPKHGGASIKVMEMTADLRQNVKDSKDRDEVESYLKELFHKEAFDRKGLIYGMGHTVCSEPDPRAEISKRFVKQLSEGKGRIDDFELYPMIEELGPKVIAEERKIYKGVSANVDFYSGFIYSMLDIPEEMFIPIFATARVVGWSVHHVEELINMDKIICPVYTSVMQGEDYKPLSQR